MEVEVDGTRLACALSGPAGAPAVLLSHSLGSSGAMWRPQVEALERRYRVLNMDTRGHGRSAAPPGPYTLDRLATDAVGLMDRLGLERVHWVGLSMGGMIGQAAALAHRGRLASLCLCDTACALPAGAQPVWRERIDTAQSRGMAGLCEDTMRRWFTAPFLDRDPPEVEAIRRIFLDTPVAGYAGCCEAICGLDHAGRLPEIAVPTLILVGADDASTPVAASEAMHAGIPGSRLVVIPDAAHLSNVEQPATFTRALTAFLDDL